MVSAVARPVRIFVGGLDFSDCFISYSGARGTADTSGLLPINGQIELQYIPGLTPESLDDRLNPERWYRGQEITLEIGNEAGGWDRFPHGALRLIEAEFDGRGRLKLKVGDLIAYGSFKEATDYRDAEIDPPVFSSASSIVNRLLAKMGMPPLIGSLGNLGINYPIDVGGNYWETIGRLAWSAGRYIYCDRFEAIRSVPMRSQPSAPDATVTIGDAEIDYGRLTGAQKPPETLIVTGARKIVTAYTPYTVSVEEKYAPAFLLGGNSTAPIVASRTTIVDDWQPDDDRRRITTTKEDARKLINPEEAGSPGLLTTSLVEVADTYYEQEGNGDDDQAKLLRTLSNRQAPQIFAIAPYEAGWQNAPYTLVDSQRVETKFTYTADEATTESQLETQWETAANIVLDENWATSPNSPYTLHENQVTETRWSETIPELEWEETIATQKTLATQSEEGEDIPDGVGFNAKLSLTEADFDRRTSNNGVRPPAPDRRPPKYSVTERPFRHEVSLPQKGGGYRARALTLRIPFLPGEVGQSVALKRRKRVYSFGSLAWPKYLGWLFGAMLIGRHKGQEISLPYSDAIAALEPLSTLDVIEPLFEGGTVTRSYLVDGDAYVLLPNENRCGFDLVWMGDRTGVTSTINVLEPDGTTTTQTVELVNPPYDSPAEIDSYGAGVGLWTTRPYGSDGAIVPIASYGAGVGLWQGSITTVDNVVVGSDNVIAGTDNVIL